MSTVPPVPKENPPFTLADLRACVPSHCFERSAVRSLSYVARDACIALALLWCAVRVDGLQLTPLLAAPFWLLYAVAQGTVLTGLWVCAHECGHSAFSPYEWLNDLVGCVLHSSLLVPYWSWKFTHSQHHAATNHMGRDSVFVPKRKSHKQQEKKHKEHVSGGVVMDSDVPMKGLLNLVVMTVFGWPAYLLANVGGQQYSRWNSHFKPFSPDIFKKHQRVRVMWSVLGLCVTMGVLTYVGARLGPLCLLKYYVGPYVFVNYWLIMYTYIQHTDRRVPHYAGAEWTFVRGALATVDRPYGIFDWFHHHIGSTHVAHHLFSRMPHYHAQEATKALQKRLGPYYAYDDTNVFKAFWRSFGECHLVDDTGDSDILWFTKE